MIAPLDSGSDGILRALQKNRTDVQGSITRIASGKRIVSAGDDPTANSISEQLQSEIRVLSQGARNAEAGGNLLKSAEGGLSVISDLVTRGRELATQAANGTLNSEQRAVLTQELNSITGEIDRIAQSSEFNGQKLLNGNLAPDSSNRVDIQVGSGSGPENKISLNVVENAGTESLGLNNLDISTAEGASQAMDKFEQAGKTIAANRGQVGAAANRLNAAVSGISSTVENLARSNSELTDTNMPEEITKLQQNVSRIQASLNILGIQNRQAGQVVGRLLDTKI